MEDILHEPLELTEGELDQIAGGGGSDYHPCGCDNGPLISVAAALAVAVAVAI